MLADLSRLLPAVANRSRMRSRSERARSGITDDDQRERALSLDGDPDQALAVLIGVIHHIDERPFTRQFALADRGATMPSPPAATDTLPGQTDPLGSPGGAAKLGAVDADTPMVAALAPQGD